MFVISPESAYTQVTPEEHASHHPDQAGAASPDPGATDTEQGSGSKPPDGSTGGMMGAGGMGGMMGEGGMGKMMERMGAPPPKQLYPSLMALPDMPIEKRQEIQSQAHERMRSGAALMAEGIEKLSRSAATTDFETMQSATATLREGLAQFESGLAAHRALAEGIAPRRVALDWFKSEMNLGTVRVNQGSAGPLGLSWLHFITMAILIAFATAMIAMYFFKMRRTAALLQRIASSPSAAPVSANIATDSAPADGSSETRSTASTPSTGAQANKHVAGDCCESGADACDSSALPDGANLSQGLLPVAERKLCRLRVVRIVQETVDVKTFRLVSCHGGGIPFNYLPGQFLTLTLPVGEKPIRRSYTISSSPTQGYYCEITVKREEQGAGSRFLHDQVNVGDTLEVKAPSGKFYFRGDDADGIVLIGGGVGITPMMSIARALTDMCWAGEIYFIAACQDPEHFIFESELNQLAEQYENFRLFVTMSRIEEDAGAYRKGRLTREKLTEWVPEIASKWVHLCGAPAMMAATKEMLLELGVAPEQIHTENFGSTQKPKSTVAAGQEEASEALASAQGGTVTFVASDTSTPMLPDETILEASERVGVEIDYSCRVGTCGECKVKLLSGEVTMEEMDGLDDGEYEQGLILACQAKSQHDISVEA
jgi:ferredoxin-NADP reductase